MDTAITHRAEIRFDGGLTVGTLTQIAEHLAETAPPEALVTIRTEYDPRDHDTWTLATVTWTTR